MKKIIALTLSLLMLASVLAGCGTPASDPSNGGAVCYASLSIDYYQLGYETGKMAASILLEGKSPADFEVMTLTPTVAYNEDLCAQLGIAAN